MDWIKGLLHTSSKINPLINQALFGFVLPNGEFFPQVYLFLRYTILDCVMEHLPAQFVKLREMRVYVARMLAAHIVPGL